MKLSLFGVGNAGVRILDRLIEADASEGRVITDGNVLAFDTTTTAFEESTSIPERRQVLLGETHPAVDHSATPDDVDTDPDGADATPDRADAASDGADAASDREGSTPDGADATPDGEGAMPDSEGGGAGVGGDPDLCAEVARDELPEIRRALDQVHETEVDAAMIVAGLGVGPLPIHVVERDVQAGMLWRLPPFDDPPAIDIYLVTNPRATLGRAERMFLDTLRAHAGDEHAVPQIFPAANGTSITRLCRRSALPQRRQAPHHVHSFDYSPAPHFNVSPSPRPLHS
jgi:hypothetical protein